MSSPITFLFTDIEGSSRLWNRYPETMADAVPRQEALLRDAIERHGGTVFKTVGDGVYAVFADAPSSIRAAVAGQRLLLSQHWPGMVDGDDLLVRVAIHTGEADTHDGDYFGPTLNRLSRTLAAGHGGQILCTHETVLACGDAWPEGIERRDLGERALRDVLGSGRIFQLVARELPEQFPPLATLDLRTHNLPRWPTSMVGREADAARLRALLRSREHRMISVLGTGGVGKTRLATEVAAQLLDEFQDGIRFVDLSPLRANEQVLDAIVQVAGAADPLVSPRNALLDWLHGRQLLLVLDNCEQVIEGVAEICSAIVQSAPDVTILATSRAPVRIRGERRIALEPLSLPDDPQTSPAVALFAQRARDVRASFALEHDNAEAIAEICRSVDGLPLAIELAAAWVRMLSPEALQHRLQESRALLRDGPRDLPDRQRTLANTIAWSYDLLEPEDQRAFRRLAVFHGGIAVDAAAAVIWNEGISDPLWALNRLDALVQANLLQVSPDATGEPRFLMLQTIQEFAIDTLREIGEWDDAAVAHAAFFSDLARESRPHHRTADSARWLDRLDREFENLQIAVDEQAATPAGLRLVIDLAGFLDQRRTVLQARSWLERAYRPEGSYPPELEAEALFYLGNTWFSDPAVAATFYRRAIAIADESGNPALRVRSVAALSTVAALSGNYATARAMANDVLAAGRAKDDPQIVALGYARLAYTACESGDEQAAIDACREWRAHAERSNDATGDAWGWLIEGRSHRRLGDRPSAESAYDHALARFSQTGDAEAVGLCFLEQGLLLLDTAPEQARPRFERAFSALVTCFDTYTVLSLLEGAARLLVFEETWDAAAECIGAAQQLREQSGIASNGRDRTALDRAIDRLLVKLGPGEFAAGLARGRDRSPRALIEQFDAIELPRPVP